MSDEVNPVHAAFAVLGLLGYLLALYLTIRYLTRNVKLPDLT